MIPAWQIHRNALVWLLLAFAGVILIHSTHLPNWITLAALVSAIWRVQRYRGVWPTPSRWVKLSLLAMCLAGLFLEYGSHLIGLEPMVALLVSAYALKLLEMEHRRDALLVVFLAFFIAAVQALFDQSIGNAIYILGCILLVIAALVGLHQGDDQSSQAQATKPRALPKLQALRSLKKGLVILLQAIPLMVLLFIIMPRLGSLWAVPIQSHSAKTGVTDTMRPGDYSRLGRSADLAFRVSFDGQIPRQHQLYWRGLVLSNFDGRQWSRSKHGAFDPEGLVEGSPLQWFGKPTQPWDSLIKRLGQPTRYSVVMEPSQQPWLYSLPTPVPQNTDIALTRDFRLISSEPITTKKQYEVDSWLDYKIETDPLSDFRRAAELYIPKGFNPRTVELAQRWRREISNDKALVRKVLGLYNEKFVYTLQPPLLGKHSVDEFLFDAQRGFCEHFSSSFVFFMRAAGVPARVVAGYQGGERHPDNYLLVRQYDAHVWAEVWIAGKGWIRVDPTAAVAPERIEANLEEALGDNEGFLADSPLSLIRFRHINWLNNFRLKLDSLNYSWARWVLGYDSIQKELLKNWLGAYNPMRIALALLIAGGGLLGLLALWQLRQRFSSKHDELDRVFLHLCQTLEKAGIPRETGEGPRAYAQRVAEQRPELARQVKAINSVYEHMRYGSESQERLKVLRKSIRRIK
jgi:transglutaminase-like putative cysteine protease/Flp pilus assembly protein protease CpaA